MGKKMVIAGPNGPVAREDNPQRFIGAEPFEIDDASAYYVRRIGDGDLVEASAIVASPPETTIVTMEELVASNPDLVIEPETKHHRKGK